MRAMSHILFLDPLVTGVYSPTGRLYAGLDCKMVLALKHRFLNELQYIQDTFVEEAL